MTTTSDSIPPDALRAWERSMRDRSMQAEPRIAAALRETPGAYAVLTLLRATRPYQATQSNDRVKSVRATHEPELEALIGLLARPNWKAVLRLEKACGRSYGLLDHFKDGPSGMTDRVCDALGVELPAARSIESFIRRGGR